MKALAITCSLFLFAVLPSTGGELNRKELISKALDAERTFHSTRQRLDKAVAAHNEAKPDRERVDAQLEEAFTTIEKPFRESILALAARIVKGDRIDEFPGILALGEITYDPEGESYSLTIDWGYGDYEGSWRLLPRSFEFNFSLSGEFLELRDSPVPESE